MSTETSTDRDRIVESTSEYVAWKRGAIGGIIGGLLFGILLSVSSPGVIHTAIPALYGLGPGAGIIGWTLHMSHSVVLGIVFAALTDAARLRPQFDTNRGGGLVGLTYGLILWVILGAIVMPVWLGVVGFAGAPAVPNVDPTSMAGHVAYGVGLGVTYAVLSEVSTTEPDATSPA